jgi:amino acid adenylation domain-containing protein
MTSHLGNTELARLKKLGLEVISPQHGLALFDSAISQPNSLLIPSHFNLLRLASQDLVHPLLSELSKTKKLRKVSQYFPNNSTLSLKQILKALPESEHISKLSSIISLEISSVLALPQGTLISAEKPFQELGFDSLMAIEVRNRLSALFNTNLPSTIILRFPTLNGLTLEILRLLDLKNESIETTNVLTTNNNPEVIEKSSIQFIENNQVTDNAITLRPQEELASPGQQRLWFLDQILEQKEAYNTHFSFKINNIFNTQAFQKALETLIARHDQLRVFFKKEDNTLKQRSLPWVEPDFALYDLTKLAEKQQEKLLSDLLKKDSYKHFNLNQAPLFRVFVATLNEKEFVICLTFHHSTIDGASVGIFLKELFLFYKAEIENKTLNLPKPLPYLIYSRKINQWLQTPEAEKQRAYWNNQLKEVEVLSLPTDKPLFQKQSQEGGLVRFEISLELSANMDKFILKNKLTAFVVLSTAWSILLGYYSRQKEFVFGTFVAGRTWAEFENTIGFFVNTLPIKCNLTNNQTLFEHLLVLQETIWLALDNQNLPYNEIVEANVNNRELLSGGLFNTTFVLEDENWVNKLPNNFSIAPITNSLDGTLEEIAQFPLGLSIMRSNDTYKANLDFLTDLFEKNTIERMAKHFLNILEELVTNSQKRFSEIQILTQEERNQLLFDWNNVQLTSSLETSVIELFEEQAKISSNKVAISFEGVELTYSQLNAQANQLANYLQNIGLSQRHIVALLMERSIKLIVSILALLKTGTTYLPLDINLPAERVNFILEDAKVNILLTDAIFSTTVNPNDINVVNIKTCWENVEQQSKENLSLDTDLENLAYIIYTSGSTGNPKGVMISHASLTSFIKSANLVYGINSQDTVLQFAPISFDLSVEEIFLTLINGAKLVLRSENMLSSMKTFLNKCQELEITVLDLPTAFWHEMVSYLATNENEIAIPKSLRQVIIGGEKALNTKLAIWQKEVGTKVRLLNTYGPTETTVVALVCDLTNLALDGKEIPIGKPLSNSQIYILDQYGNPSPIGVAGELYIGGNSLAKGYLNHAKLTGEKFVKKPFSSDQNSRLYKTGDLVRWRADGNVEFIGRIDNQVKLRGFRIELGEIETTISQHSSIQECVVQLKGEEIENKQLVAYLVAKESDSRQLVKELRTYLKTKLPDYMIPPTFLLLKELPLTPNGKIDHKMLSKLNSKNLIESEQSRSCLVPRTNVEKILTEVWKETLSIDRLGIQDNFFELGGNSLKTIKLVGLASKKGIEINARDIFTYPTIAELASSLGDEQKSKTCLTSLRKGSTKTTLVYLPGAGGTLFDAPTLANTLKVDVNIVGLTIPSLVGLGTMPDTLEELCSLYISELAGEQEPFILVGHSFGGTLALELAKRLQESNRDVKQVIMLDSWLPELVPDLSKKEVLIELALQFNLDVNLVDTEDNIFNQIVDFLEFEKLDNLEPKTWLNLIFDAIEKSTNMLKGWKPEELNIPIHLIRASKIPEKITQGKITQDLGWNKYIYLFSNKEVTGNHFDIVRQPHVVKTAQIIDEILSKYTF